MTITTISAAAFLTTLLTLTSPAATSAGIHGGPAAGVLYAGTSDAQVFPAPFDLHALGAAWNSVGPNPPAVEAPIAVDVASGTVYIGSFGGGVLKSTDSGQSYGWVNHGLGSLAITSMAMDPANPNNVVVGTPGNGVFRTVDGGETWTGTTDTTGVVTFVAVDPLDPSIWYAGYMGGPTIRKSTDGGKTWVTSSSGIATSSVWSIVPDPRNSGVVYAATAGSGGFRSSNSGLTWTPMPLPPVVWFLALDPTDSQIVYAATNGEGVFKSENAGATFTRVGSPSIGVVISLAVDPTDTQRLYAATASAGIEVSEDGGGTWTPTSIRKGLALTVTVTSTGQVFAGTGFDGAFFLERAIRPEGAGEEPEGGDRSEGRRRHPARFKSIVSGELRAVNAQNIVNIVIDPRNTNHVILGTNDGGILATEDGGERWADVGNGFLSRASRRAVFDPNVDGRVYAGSFNGGGLYRSDDNGSTWRRSILGSAVVYVWAAGVDPFSDAVYAGTQNGEGLWRSKDEGATFTRVDGSLIPQVRDIVFDRTTRDKMFIAAINGLFRSLDGGKTFSKLASGAINSVTIDPANAKIVYAGTQTAGVLKSVDGGATFATTNTGLTTTFSTSRGNGVAIDPTNSSILYVATEGAGVFKSMNAGASWFAINDGLTNLRVFGLAIDPDHPNVLYVGGSSGIFKTLTGGESR